MARNYGWLNNYGGGGSSGGGGGKAFQAMSASDPDVVALWNFAETNGSTFTDDVSSVVLTRTGTTTINSYFNYEVNNYQVTEGGPLQNIAPGFGWQQAQLSTATGVDTTLGNGTGSFTYEMYFQSLEPGIGRAFGFESAGTGFGQFFLYRNPYLYFRLQATDATVVVCQTPTDNSKYNVSNGELQHIRFVYDAGSTMAIYLNGNLEKSVSAASLSGKTLEVDRLNLFGAVDHSGIIVYQARISHNATNDGYGYA